MDIEGLDEVDAELKQLVANLTPAKQRALLEYVAWLWFGDATRMVADDRLLEQRVRLNFDRIPQLGELMGGVYALRELLLDPNSSPRGWRDTLSSE